MKNNVNRQWVLANHPTGMVTTADFNQVDTEITPPGDGEILVKVTHVAFEPAMRGWIAEGDSYVKGVQIGEVMRAQTVGEVIESNNADYKPGDRVSGFFGWQEYATVNPVGGMFPTQVLPDAVTAEMALSALGITGLTAWRVARHWSTKGRRHGRCLWRRGCHRQHCGPNCQDQGLQGYRHRRWARKMPMAGRRIGL